VIAYQSPQLDALGDVTRRAILLQLLEKPQPVGELARHFPVSRPAISQHLRLLKDAGLVSDHSSGARRVYQINAEGFLPLRDFFDRFWSTALAAFKQKVEQT
jgi:DNA-binding transcriptional ArsR family regulator